eukprot:1964384-Lingulodinium_polyedra.AAC.1
MQFRLGAWPGDYPQLIWGDETKKKREGFWRDLAGPIRWVWSEYRGFNMYLNRSGKMGSRNTWQWMRRQQY